MYLQGYHQVVARRLKSITANELEISDIYSLLDWLHNTYRRYPLVQGVFDLRCFNRLSS